MAGLQSLVDSMTKKSHRDDIDEEIHHSQLSINGSFREKKSPLGEAKDSEVGKKLLDGLNKRTHAL
jgi:hypothetical protein